MAQSQETQSEAPDDHVLTNQPPTSQADLCGFPGLHLGQFALGTSSQVQAPTRSLRGLGRVGGRKGAVSWKGGANGHSPASISVHWPLPHARSALWDCPASRGLRVREAEVMLPWGTYGAEESPCPGTEALIQGLTSEETIV